MAMFGNEHAGTNWRTCQNLILGTLVTCPEAGTGLYIKVKVQGQSFAHDMKCCLYDAAGNKIVNGETEEKVIPGDSAWHETQFNFLVAPTLANQQYIICAWAGGPAPGGPYIAGEWAAGGKSDSQAYNGWPDPATLVNEPFGANHWISCYYTPAPAGWTGKIAGVTNPAVIAGKAIANIADVKGVA